MGNLLRAEIKADTDIGRQIGDILKRGDLVPVEITEQLLLRRLEKPDAVDGIILDGYPRSRSQLDQLVRILDRLGKKIEHVILLEITDEEALRRLAGRRVCKNPDCELNYHVEFNPPKEPGKCDRCGSELKQRKDDEPEAIRRRLGLYHQETKPLIEDYRKMGVLREIDGMRSIDEVAKSMCTVSCPFEGGCGC
jgi:adenylate kinase